MCSRVACGVFEGVAMESMSRRIAIVALLLVALATAMFIFAHGMQGSATSWGESDVIAALFEPVLQRLYGLVGSIVNWTGHDWGLTYGVFVRKCAHVVEYSLFGAECAALTVAIVGRVVSPYLWADLFVPLGVAVADEFIQSFVGRTSLGSDVVLDYCAALTGIAIVLVVASIVVRK